MFSILRIVIDEFRRMFALLIFIMLTFVLITGCQTVATKKGQWIMSNLQASSQRAKACSKYILNKPAYQRVFSHLPPQSNITPMHMADTSRPTEEDVKNIIAIYNEESQCRKQNIEAVSRILPSFVGLLVDNYRANDLITADLIERKISWGEANKRRSDVYNDSKAKSWAALSRLDKELKMAHEAEIANDQAAIQALGNTLAEWRNQQQALADRMQNQQLIDNLNRPRSTNCQIFGNTVQCTTY